MSQSSNTPQAGTASVAAFQIAWIIRIRAANPSQPDYVFDSQSTTTPRSKFSKHEGVCRGHTRIKKRAFVPTDVLKIIYTLETQGGRYELRNFRFNPAPPDFSNFDLRPGQFSFTTTRVTISTWSLSFTVRDMQTNQDFDIDPEITHNDQFEVPPNQVCGDWFEIHVADMMRARAFYEEMFGIELQRIVIAGQEMWAFPKESGMGGCGGALVYREGVAPSAGGTVIYLSCTDSGATAQAAEIAGGTILRSKTALDKRGFMSLIRDSEGNTVGLISKK